MRDEFAVKLAVHRERKRCPIDLDGLDGAALLAHELSLVIDDSQIKDEIHALG